jgi:hypothetical protein
MFSVLYDRAIDLNGTLMPVALILTTFGIIAYGMKGMNGDINGMLRGMASTLIVAILIPLFPEILNDIQLLTYALVEDMGANPSVSSQKFGNLIMAKTSDGESEVGFFDILTDSGGGFGKAMLYLVLLLTSFFALVIQYLLFVSQQILMIYGIAAAPIFLTAFLVSSLREIATKYFLSLCAIALWPLGWSFADLVTSELLMQAAEAEIKSQYLPGFVLRSAQSLFFAFTVSIWLLVSTIAAPYVVSKVVTTGANAGGALFGRFGSALGLGVSYGVMAGATANMTGASGLRTAFASGAAGLGGVMSGGAGGGGFLIPAAIGMAAAKSNLGKDDKAPTDYNKKASKIFS